MAISASDIVRLNKMNRAAQRASLGAAVSNLETLAIRSGSVSVSAAEANGSAVTVYTGLSSVKGYIVDVYRAGSALSSTWYVATSSGSMTISKSGSYAVTTGDRINWIAY